MLTRPARIDGGEHVFEMLFGLGTVVYFRTRTERIPGMVTGYLVRASGVGYIVRWGDDACECTHSEIELTTEEPTP